MLSTRSADTLRIALQMQEFKERVGHRIAAARKAKGWTQTQLAREILLLIRVWQERKKGR